MDQTSSQQQQLTPPDIGEAVVPAYRDDISVTYTTSDEERTERILISCRLVPMDQWFTTHINPSWTVKETKIHLLQKALGPLSSARQKALSSHTAPLTRSLSAVRPGRTPGSPPALKIYVPTKAVSIKSPSHPKSPALQPPWSPTSPRYSTSPPSSFPHNSASSPPSRSSISIHNSSLGSPTESDGSGGSTGPPVFARNPDDEDFSPDEMMFHETDYLRNTVASPNDLSDEQEYYSSDIEQQSRNRRAEARLSLTEALLSTPPQSHFVHRASSHNALTQNSSSGVTPRRYGSTTSKHSRAKLSQTMNHFTGFSGSSKDAWDSESRRESSNATSFISEEEGRALEELRSVDWALSNFATMLIMEESDLLSYHRLRSGDLIEIHRRSEYQPIPRHIYAEPCFDSLAYVPKKVRPKGKSKLDHRDSQSSFDTLDLTVKSSSSSMSMRASAPPRILTTTPSIKVKGPHRPSRHAKNGSIHNPDSPDPQTRDDSNAGYTVMSEGILPRDVASHHLHPQIHPHPSSSSLRNQLRGKITDPDKSTGPKKAWKLRWAVVRDGNLRIWREKNRGLPLEEYPIAQLLSIREVQLSVAPTYPTQPRYCICAVFSDATSGVRSELFLKMPDEHTHKQLLRILCRASPLRGQPSVSSSFTQQVPYPQWRGHLIERAICVGKALNVIDGDTVRGPWQEPDPESTSDGPWKSSSSDQEWEGWEQEFDNFTPAMFNTFGIGLNLDDDELDTQRDYGSTISSSMSGGGLGRARSKSVATVSSPHSPIGFVGQDEGTAWPFNETTSAFSAFRAPSINRPRSSTVTARSSASQSSASTITQAPDSSQGRERRDTFLSRGISAKKKHRPTASPRL